MTEMFRCRIDRALIRKATRVAKDVGTTPGEVVRLLFAQMAKQRAVPFPLEVETPEDEILSSPKRRARMMDEMYEGKPTAR